MNAHIKVLLLEIRKHNDGPKGKKKEELLEERASWLKGNQSQAVDSHTVLQLRLKA